MPGFLLIILFVLLCGIALATVRLALGPTLADRVVALDVISALAVGTTAVFAVFSGFAVLLDIAVVLALVSFVATVGFARYLERKVLES